MDTIQVQVQIRTICPLCDQYRLAAARVQGDSIEVECLTCRGLHQADRREKAALKQHSRLVGQACERPHVDVAAPAPAQVQPGSGQVILRALRLSNAERTVGRGR